MACFDATAKRMRRMAYDKQDDRQLQRNATFRVTGHFSTVALMISAPLKTKGDYFCRLCLAVFVEHDQGFDLCSHASFPMRYVLDREIGVDPRNHSVPPRVHSLPDIPTREEVHRPDQYGAQVALPACLLVNLQPGPAHQ